MAAPTTVLQFTTLQNNNLTTALKNAQSELATKQGAFAAATAALATFQSQLATIVADMASVRNQLADSATPEDGSALLLQLQNGITKSRRITGAIALAKRDLAVAKAEAKVAASETQRLSAALADSTGALGDATAQDKRRNALKAALTLPPLNTITADSAAVIAGTAFLDAAKKYKLADVQSRLQGDLPVSLMSQAAERLQDEVNTGNGQLRGVPAGAVPGGGQMDF